MATPQVKSSSDQILSTQGPQLQLDVSKGLRRHLVSKASELGLVNGFVCISMFNSRILHIHI